MRKEPAQGYQVRRGALTDLATLVEKAGGSVDSLLQHCGLAAGQLEHPEERMPVADLICVLNAAARLPGLQQSGLQLAQIQGLEVLGVLGQLLQRSATLQQAFAQVRRYMALHNQGEQWRLAEAGEYLAIRRFEQACFGQDGRQYRELALGNCLRLMQILAGSPVRPQRVEFSHRPLADIAGYRRFFGCEVRFDCEQDQLVFSPGIMSLPVAMQEDTGQISSAYVQQLCQRYQNDLRSQMVTLIMQTLGAQQHSLQHIAGLMALHPRTLQRRLESEGIVFRKLVAEVRNNLACWHLASSDMDITLLAAALGYTDVSGFSRAFRHWHGCSPRQWRQSCSV